MQQKINNRLIILTSVLVLLFSPFVLACNAVIHSFSQSAGNTQGSFTYSCWGTYYCRVEIKKNGIVQLDTTITQGNYQSYAFDYGAGNFTITVKSYLKAPNSGGGYIPVLQNSSSISVVISAGSSASTGSTTYTYDALGRLKSAVISGGKTTNYSYDNADNRTNKTVTD